MGWAGQLPIPAPFAGRPFLMSPLLEVTLLALRLGFTAFGGPAAHIAMLHHEVVERRKWVSEQHFLDLLGATNLIPGPNSTEMVIHIGYVRAGWAGLVLAGLGFITPAMGIVLGLAWLYVRYGTTPAAGALLYGIKPVIIALIVQALWTLGRKAVVDWLTALVAAGALALLLLGFNEIALLAVGAVLVLAVRQGGRLWQREGASGGPGAAAALLLGVGTLGVLAMAAPYSLGRLFWSFLKIGSVLYGGGYVLLAFVRSEFVEGLGWLTDAQLLDAVAVGQVTPGPLFTTATFIGFLMGGVPGALVATLGIFLPAFVLVAITNPWVPRLRESAIASHLLDGVNAAALGLMAAVTLQIAHASLIDPLTLGLAVAAAVGLLRFKPNATWLVLGGAIVGLLASALRR